MDHHAIAAISFTGICLDVFGGLYLAYDLLGGQHGPLRLLTRIVTYSIVFGIGYGLGLGLFFGIASGAATGVTVAIELNRMGKRHDHFSLPWEALFSAIRGVGFAAGLFRTLGFAYAAAFGALITAGQVVAYSRRDAAKHGLCGVAAVSVHASAGVGDGPTDGGLHGGGVAVQRAGAPRGSSLAIRAPTGIGDGRGDRCGHHREWWRRNGEEVSG